MMTGSIVDFDQTVQGCWDVSPKPEAPVDAGTPAQG
jgi:hypothetical protein